MTLAALVRQASTRLAYRSSTKSSEGGGDQNAALDAEVLARHVLGWSREQWIAGSRSAPPADFAARFDALVARRATGEPVAYITGTREFWGLDFEVTPAVLIPRPETEFLVEEALALVDARGLTRIADAGTGSGCIAVALAHSRPALRIAATDISNAALDVAARNARRHGVDDRIDFQHADLLDGVRDVDLIVSNPPYIPMRDAGTLMRDVVDFEPHSALFAGGDGLDIIRALLAGAAARQPSPPVIFEFGTSEQSVRDAVAASGLRLVKIVCDLAGIPRIAVAER